MKLTSIEINKLAAAAKQDALNGMLWYESESIAALYVVMRDDIDRAAASLVGRVNETAENAFTERAEQMISYALKRWNPCEGDFRPYARRNVERAKKSFLKDRSSYASITDSFEYLTFEGNEGKPAIVYIEDSKENVEQKIIDREFIDLIIEKYGRNARTTFIIESIFEPTQKKQIDIARELAETFGMTENAATQVVKRFRADMKKELALV